MKRLLFLLTFLMFVIGSYAQSTEHIYDFNSLQMADLDGQDDWVTILHTSGPHDIFIDIAAGSVVSPDGSQAAYYNGSGGGYGRTATRKATANFDFDFTAGAVIELEIEMHRNYWGMFFGAGFDADGDGHIAPGLSTEEDDGGIQLNISGQNPDNNKVILPNGESIIFTGDNSGWCNYKLVLDFLANNEEGAVALFYDPGVTGEWLPINEVQGINMGMTPGSGDIRDRNVWDGIFFHSQGATGGFDNILIREPENNGQLQFIDFPDIGDMFNTNPPFLLEATASSGLAVEFSIVDGPVTLDGDILTLTGDVGFVTVMASQPGDGTWAPAPDVTQTFEVIDPLLIYPELDIKNAVDGATVSAPDLTAIAFSASTSIQYPHLLAVHKLDFEIDGETITAEKMKNGYFLAYWIPPDFGTYSLTATAYSSQGPTSSQTVTFEVVEAAPDMDFTVVDHQSFQTSNNLDTTITLPSFSGTYDKVYAYLNYDCPCDPWDRIANVEIRGAGGEYIELFRYITPYGVACDDAIDITDFVSQLQGKIDFRFNFTQSYVTLNFEYVSGTPEYPYSWIYKLWDGSYSFGNMDNLQPLEVYNLNIAPETEDAYLRIISSGHGWGANNTGNAAEFYEATHHIKIDGETAFDQHLWQDCNPNPTGCQPQNGTWFYDRAGWCPGSIPILYRYHLNNYLGGSNMELMYQWDPDYVDYCHPSNPDCISGVTCDDCNAGSNPVIVVAGEFVVFSNNIITGLNDTPLETLNIELSPNPSNGLVKLSANGKSLDKAHYSVHSITGQIIFENDWNGQDQLLDLSSHSNGMYFIKVRTNQGTKTIKLIIQ